MAVESRTEHDVAKAVCDLQNERLAELCATYPDRFLGYASLALQYPDVAVQQLEYAMKTLGMKGAAIPLWAVAVVFIVYTAPGPPVPLRR